MFSGFHAGQFSDTGLFPALLQRVGMFAVVLVVKVGVLFVYRYFHFLMVIFAIKTVDISKNTLTILLHPIS